jgi:hypothetical protein
MKLEFSQWIVEKYSILKFHENPSSGGRVALCNFAKALKSHVNKTVHYSQSMTTILRGFLVASGALNGQDIWFVFMVGICSTET